MRKLIWLVALLSSQAFAQDFTDAQVLNVETKQGLSNGVSGLASDNYTLVTLQVGEIKVSARTYEMGGGAFYLAQHPEAMTVGSTVPARIAKRGILEVKVPPKDKVLKFNVERMEKTS